MEVQLTRDQLEVPINRNQVMVSQITLFESQMSNIQFLFGHRDAEITRLMSEVSRLQSSAPAPVDVASGNLSGAVEDRVVEVPNEPHANVFQSSMEQRMDSMMAAIQCLSDRMGYYEHNGTDPNSRNPDGNNRAPQPPGLRIPVGLPAPPPEDGDWPEARGQRMRGVTRYR